MATDSKDRARADAALREYERFRSFADTAPVMLWVTDADGECTFLSQEWCPQPVCRQTNQGPTQSH